MLLKNDVNNRKLSLLKISYGDTQLWFYESPAEFRRSLVFLEGGVELNVWRVFNYDFPTTQIKHADVPFDRIVRFYVYSNNRSPLVRKMFEDMEYRYVAIYLETLKETGLEVKGTP